MITAFVIITSILSVIVSAILRRSWKKNTRSVIDLLITGDESTIEEAISLLDVLVLRVYKDEPNKLREKLPLEAPKKIKSFMVQVCRKVDKNTFLFCTIAKYSDQENDYETMIMFKLIFTEDTKNNIYVYSDMHDTLVEKNLRTDFAMLLLERLSD
jgi:hypothetical protein